MRTLAFMAALAIGGAAVAQTDTQTSTSGGQATAQTGAQTTTDAGAGDPAVQGSQVVAPANSNPEEDARGIAVISAPAEVPEGANQAVAAAPGAQMVPAPNQQAVFSTRPSAEEYPACSATVTDNCVQAYEGRGSRRRR